MIKRYSIHSLRQHNTFGLNVNASQFIEFDSECELVDAIVQGLTTPVLVIGAGSNLLFLGDYKGTILHSAITDMDVVEDNEDYVLLRVGSGVQWDNLVEYTIQNGWQGLENLSAIPGEVGASAVQNVGAYGVEAGELIVRVDAVSLLDGSLRSFSHDDCRFSYRNSIFKTDEKNKNVVTYVTYRLNKKPKYRLDYGNLHSVADAAGNITAAAIRKAVKEIRAAKLPDPSVIGSAGSFFMNPVVSNEHAQCLLVQYEQMPHYATADGRTKLSAAWLIDQCGWKNKRKGNVGVYNHQPLVVVNYGGATGQEILDYSMQICNSVKEKFGVTLNREVNVIE